MVLDFYRPYVSGLSVTVERLAAGLSDRGHAVAVLAHQHDPKLPREEQVGAVRVLRAPVLARIGKAQISPSLLTLAARELGRTDVLHLHAPLVPAVPLASIAAARGVPLVANYHCDLRLPRGAVNRVLETIARASQNFALDRASVIINSTEDYARATPALATRLSKFVGIVPPVPDLPAGAVSAEQLASRWKISGRPIVLFVGRFAEEKGLPHLIAALPAIRSRFPEAVLLLAGESEAIPGETVGQRLAPLLADRKSGVIATGFVADEEMASLFRLADVLALPSTNSTESFGMIQVEAMLCGLPVVASDLPGVREPVRRSGMGEIARAGSPEDLARQIIRVLEAPQRYRKPHETVREIFSVESTFSAYESAYRRALEARQ
ncbi:MAG TPA: glycosyltransferase family 4 protein [Thermoanaerobaculia bacterium]